MPTKNKQKSIRLLHTADWHLGKRLNQFSRMDEQRQVLDEICQIADAEAVQAVLIAGDVFDSFTPSHEAEDLLYQTLARLAKGGQRAVILIAGNHDSPLKIENPDPLARATGIICAGFPDSHIRPFAIENTGLKLLRSQPGFVELQLPGADFPLRLLLTPYANAVRFKQALSGEDGEKSIETLLQHSWERIAEINCDKNGVNLLLAHLFMMRKGGEKPEEPEEEKSILHIGGAEAVFCENVPEAIQYVALGHLHRRMTISDIPCPMVYSSSPLAYSMSEADQQKYVVIIEAQPGKAVKLRDIAINGGRRLLRGAFADVDAAINWLTAHPDAIVEITMKTDTFLETEALKRLYQAHERILNVIPQVSQNTADGSGAADLANPLMDMDTLFNQYFRSWSNGQQPNETLLALFREITGMDDDDSEDSEDSP